MTRLLIAVFTLVGVMTVLGACNRVSHQAVTQHIEVRDSIQYVERLITDTIVIPPEVITMRISVPAECDSALQNAMKQPVRQTTSRASLELQVVDGQLVAEANCLEYIEELNRREVIIKHLKENLDHTVETITIRERYVPWLHKTALVLCIAMGVGFAAKFAINKYNPLKLFS